MKYTFIVMLLMGLVGGSTSPAHAQERTPDPLPTASVTRVERTDNIAYIPDGHPRQTLDVYQPQHPDPVPVIVMIHGGGYIAGSKNMLSDAAQWFAERGYAVVVPGYRLAPDFTYPAQINDAFCALAWTYSHADEYGFDTDDLILLGESAGANAAALLATVDTPQTYLSDCPYTLPDNAQPAGVVAYYMPVDLSTCECQLAKTLSYTYLGVSADEIENVDEARNLWDEASPLSWMDANDPPFLLIHGTDDFLIPVSESRYFVEEYESAGAQAELVALEGAGHGFFAYLNREAAQQALPYVMDFIERLLANDNVNLSASTD
jgi:acetyl esterase/lipase